MHGLTAFQRDILVVLADEEKYGLAIKRALEERYAEQVNHGRLYPNLDALVDAGLLSKRSLDQRTNGYRLTSRGYHAIEDQRSWENSFLEESDVTIVGVRACNETAGDADAAAAAESDHDEGEGDGDRPIDVPALSD